MRDMGRSRRPLLPLLLILATIQFVHVLDFVIIMPLGPQLMRVLGIGPQQFSLLVSSYNVAAAIASLAGAFVLDRFPRKNALLFIFSGFIVGTAACAFASEGDSLFIARFVTGAFGGLIQALLFAIIGDSFPEQSRGTAIGTVTSAFSFASVIGVPIGLYLADHFDWRTPFIVLSGVSLLTLVAASIVLPEMTSHLKSAGTVPTDTRAGLGVGGRSAEQEKPAPILAPRSPTEQFRATLALFRERNTLAAFSLVVSLMFAGLTIIPFIGAYLVSNVGLEERDLATVFLAGGIATMITSRLTGKMSDRFGKARVFKWLAVFSILPIIVLTHLPQVHIAIALFVTTVFTVSVSARGIPALAMITSSVEASRRGSFLSLTSSVQQAGSALASFFGGLILGQTATGEITHYGMVGNFAVVATIIAILAARQLRAVNESRAQTSQASTSKQRLGG